MEKLPGALGIVLFVQGIANIMGPPIAGKFFIITIITLHKFPIGVINS